MCRGFPPTWDEGRFLKTAQCAVLLPEMSKHIRPVFAVPEATVALTVAETAVAEQLMRGTL
jgi:hypothetical protein